MPRVVVIPVMPATREDEEGGQQVQGQPRQFSETLYLNKIQKRARDMAQWLSAPESNPQYQK